MTIMIMMIAVMQCAVYSIAVMLCNVPSLLSMAQKNKEGEFLLA